MRKWAITLSVLVLTTLGAFDLARSCDSLVREFSLGVVALVDSETADWLWWKISLESEDTPVEVLTGPATLPLDIPDDVISMDNEWIEVQSGNVTLIPPLDLVILTKPYWATSLHAFVSDVLPRNPQLQHAEPPYVEEPHLLYQIGGGVEGLKTQALIAESGEAWLWRVGSDEAQFPVGKKLSLSNQRAHAIISLAREAKLARSQETIFHCGVLDGRTISLLLLQAQTVGRVSYLTNAEPTGTTTELLELLSEELGLDPIRLTALDESPNPSLQRTRPWCC